MGAFLQSRQPQSHQEYQQFQQIAQRHRMVSQALYHGFREPPAVLLANAAKAEAARSSSSISDDSSSAAMDVEEPLSISAPPYEWIPLLGQCFGARLCCGGCSASHGETEYYWEVCPLSHAIQSESEAAKEAGMATVIGQFAGWNVTRLPSLVTPLADLRTPRALLEYEGGEPCWGAGPRSARVELRCGEKTELAAVDENGKCKYEFVLLTPFACGVPFREEERKQVEEAAAVAAREEAEAEAAAQQQQAEAAEAEGAAKKAKKKKKKKKAAAEDDD